MAKYRKSSDKEENYNFTQIREERHLEKQLHFYFLQSFMQSLEAKEKVVQSNFTQIKTELTRAIGRAAKQPTENLNLDL